MEAELLNRVTGFVAVGGRLAAVAV